MTDEGARHPFRASLPPHVRYFEDSASFASLMHLTASDVRGVATTYFATLAATLAFIL